MSEKEYYSKYFISTADLKGQTPLIMDNPKEQCKLDEDKLTRLINEAINKDIPANLHEKIKIEGMLLYYSINNDLVKIERSLRDAKNAKMVLVQKYDRAKENLILHDKILASQTTDTRNYFGILCAIYDSVVKYTLPSAKVISDLSKIQSEIEQKETNNTKLMEKIAESLQPLNIPKCIMKSETITKMFFEMAAFIRENRNKYMNLEKSSQDIYNISIRQRDIIQKDVIGILQNISEIENKIIEIETDYNKVKTNMDRLLNYMQDKLEIQIKDNIPLLY